MNRAPTPPALAVRDLTVVAGTPATRVIRNIDLTVGDNATLGIVGESGSGKTTLGLALLGHCRPGLSRSGGGVHVAGQDVFALEPPDLARLRARTIAYVQQNAGATLTPTRRIGPLIEEALANCGVADRRARHARCLALLAEMGLSPPDRFWRRYPHQLSGGQQQRCLIALALAGRPSILVLDEPTSGLDSTTARRLVALLQDIRRARGLTLICISHDLRLVGELCDRTAVMYRGEIVEDGPTPRLFAGPRHPYARTLLSALPRLAPAAARDRAMTARRRDPDRQNGPAILEIAALSVSYAKPGAVRRLLGRRAPMDALALRNVSLSLRAGRVLGVVGGSGSGKSTLLRSIAGLLRPIRGSIRFDGRHDLGQGAAGRPLQVARRVQMIWQNPLTALNPRATVLAALAAPLRLYFGLDGDRLRQRAAALLHDVELSPALLSRYPGQLSGGEAQRVAIARACAAEPDVFLCDEITSALDVSVQATILALIAELRRRSGAAFVFVSHDLAVVHDLADDVAVFHRGEVCEKGAVDQVLDRPAHDHTRALVAAHRPRSAPQPPAEAHA